MGIIDDANNGDPSRPYRLRAGRHFIRQFQAFAEARGAGLLTLAQSTMVDLGLIDLDIPVICHPRHNYSVGERDPAASRMTTAGTGQL